MTDFRCFDCGESLSTLPRPADRPFGLTLLALYSGFSGVLTLVMTLPVVFLASLAEYRFFNSFQATTLPLLALLLPVIGLLDLALAVGLWTRQHWAHPLAISLFIVGPSLSIFFLVADPHGSLQRLMTVGECLIAVGVLVYLFSPTPRAQFNPA
jgi:hypothetical protein